MNDTELSCGGRSECFSPVVIACNCGVPVVLLCEGCISSHVLKPGNHRLLGINQAKQLLSTPSLSVNLEESYIEYLRIKSEMIAYIQRLKDFKVKIADFKLEIMCSIEKIVDSKLEQIDSMLDHTYLQLYELNKESDNKAARRFEEKGLEGVIQNYIYNMNLNIYDMNQAINNMIIIEAKDSPQIQSSNQSILSIEIQELRELLQAQALRSDELENRLNHLQEVSVRELEDKSQVFEGLVRELRDKTQVFEVSIKDQQARAKLNENSFRLLDDNMKAIYDTLEKLKSYPNTIVQQTNQTLQEIQQVFNQRYANIDQEINSIKQLTTQIHEIQAENIEIQVIQPQPTQTYRNHIEEEVKMIPEFEEVKLPQLIRASRISQELYSRSSTFDLKCDSKQLVKYDSDNNTITTYSLNNLPYKLCFAATCMLPDESIIIAGG